MSEVKLKKGMTMANAAKAVSGLSEKYNISQAGEGRKFFRTLTDESVATLATIHWSEDKEVMYLYVKDEQDRSYYVSPVNRIDYDMVQSLDPEDVGKTVPVVIAPQVPDEITEESLQRVEKLYGETATNRYRTAKANNEVYFALISIGEVEQD